MTRSSGALPQGAWIDAEAFAIATQEVDHEAVHELCADPHRLRALTLALAAVLADTPEAMAKLFRQTVVVRPLGRLSPCGTHAAYIRHRNHGTEPCLRCIGAERVYQQERHQRRKAYDSAHRGHR